MPKVFAYTIHTHVSQHVELICVVSGIAVVVTIKDQKMFVIFFRWQPDYWGAPGQSEIWSECLFSLVPTKYTKKE